MARHGFSGVTVRRLASAEGTSTTAVYSLFGGKEGLMQAVFSRAMHSATASLFGVALTGDIDSDLRAYGRAYFSWAMQNPQLFRIFLGSSTGTSAPPAVMRAVAMEALEPLRMCVARDPRVRMPPLDAAIVLWSAVHGVASLATVRALPDPDAAPRLLKITMDAALAGIRAPSVGL